MASSSPSQPDTRSLRKVRFDSLEPIRAIYRRATKAFVLNQHGQVWTAIHDGLARIAGLLLPRPPPAQPPCWLAPADARHPPSIDSTLDHELLQLERKFLILKITFLAALSQAHPAQRPPSISADLSADQAGLLAPFLQLADHPHQLLLRLIADICPAPRLHQIHPSILAAIGLASIKLSVPQTGKDLIQACQWQLAADFIHSHLSADILPPETVDTLLEALKTAQAHQAQASKHTLHRLHQRREEPEASRAKYSSGSSAGIRPSLGSPSSPGYAGFRTRLSRFVAADPGASAPRLPIASASPSAAAAALKAFVSRLLALLKILVTHLP
ncbi:hypothetical protein PtA15_8A114 [Puccinia triticina]|uniref:Uncharacterized protein n=1 Tax=Puccinia triticina TaxID=208348 RepID=A0ABY7CQJ7_9BASI|nr:uncharacterized protein PtA15_8A114 [Puccinia triticina]WAQ87213.1 hypothetical protein PtA15_8A114 [Puccinia triticina]